MKKILLAAYILILGGTILTPSISRAITDPATFTTLPATFKVDDQKASDPIKLDNPLGDVDDIPSLIGRIIKAALSVVGSLALVMFIYGGFTWMLAGGNSEAVTKGRNIILWAAIGLVVIFTSYALVNFVIKSLAGSS